MPYALERPGHHPERRAFGGFCYFNSSAVAAHFLSLHGRVAVLGIDYHHGNGTQDIFCSRADVLAPFLHGYSRFAYHYFRGFNDETGEGEGKGMNRKYPLPERVTARHSRDVLAGALCRVRRFRPDYLVVALGLDTAKGDPTGTWDFLPADFEQNGHMIGSLECPVLVVQEGGSKTRSLGTKARQFFIGLWSESFRKS